MLTSMALVPSVALSQDSAGIGGTVQDNTGLVLPGVTVVVESPALLAPRTGVTDGTGNYLVTSLPPGTYTATFSLDGFSNVSREGVVLSGAFMADVDVSLSVGDVSETVTVSGAAPLVDVRSTRNQQVLTADRVNVLPGAANIYSAGQYVPGPHSTNVRSHHTSAHVALDESDEHAP